MSPIRPVFTNIYDIPETIRILQGARLDFDQAQALIYKAYDLGVDGNPDMGKAKEEFYDTHEIEGDIWVKKATK